MTTQALTVEWGADDVQQGCLREVRSPGSHRITRKLTSNAHSQALPLPSWVRCSEPGAQQRG